MQSFPSEWEQSLRKRFARAEHNYAELDVDSMSEPPVPAANLLDDAGLTEYITVEAAAVNNDVYAPEHWRRYSGGGPSQQRRRNLSDFLKGRATTRGQAAVDELWTEGWETQAKFWPREQADAYCVFALTTFSASTLDTLYAFIWYRKHALQHQGWFFFVHGWLVAQRAGLKKLRKTKWFSVWSRMYNVDALPADPDERWADAVEGFKEPLDVGNSRHLTDRALPARIAGPDEVSLDIDMNNFEGSEIVQPVPSEAFTSASFAPPALTKEALGRMHESAFALLDKLNTTLEKHPPEPDDVYNRKLLTIDFQIEDLEAEVERAKEAVEECKKKRDMLVASRSVAGDRGSIKRLTHLLNDKRSGDSVDEVEFSMLSKLLCERTAETFDTA